MKFRRWNRFYAFINGYFWLPCPLCGAFFGGHEWTNHDGIPKPGEPSIKRGICDDCAEERGPCRNKIDGGSSQQ